jgi:hypothetical protein
MERRSGSLSPERSGKDGTARIERLTMTRSTYVPEDFGSELAAPSGYYQPQTQALLDHDGRLLLYILGTACIEASCCGVGSWSYVRVEGYLLEPGSFETRRKGTPVEIDTVDDPGQRAVIGALLLEKHPGSRVEFR